MVEEVEDVQLVLQLKALAELEHFLQ
jgi:hypothetical protein